MKKHLLRIVLLLMFGVCAFKFYDIHWLRHRYLITAYCDCPICINRVGFRDGKFANMQSVHWGGMAADKSVPFGASVELLPVTVKDLLAVDTYLGKRRHFTVEDRGSKIRGKRLDIYFPQSRGGHEAALHWGARRMRVRINGKLAD